MKVPVPIKKFDGSVEEFLDKLGRRHENPAYFVKQRGRIYYCAYWEDEFEWIMTIEKHSKSAVPDEYTYIIRKDFNNYFSYIFGDEG